MSDTLRNYTKPIAEFDPNSKPDEWADRSRYWAAKADRTPARKRRQRRTEPLVLAGHGLSVRVDKGCLFVKGGKTHYPAEPKELRYFKGGLDLPPRIITLDGSGIISLDALDWMAEQGMTFVRINYDGSHSMVMSPTGYSAIPKKVSWQLETRENQKQQLAFAIETTRNKFKAAIETLEKHISKSEKQIAAIEIHKKASLELLKSKSLSFLLGIEGKAALAYWHAWRGLSLKWKSQSRYPIPDEWKVFRARSSLLTGVESVSMRASNPINAMLNYTYAVLMTEMRIKAIADEYDPMIGILHDQRRRKDRPPAFALDLMEPLRPVVDRTILQLISKETFSGADFQLQSDGVCRLNPELARRLAGLVSVD